MADADDEDSRAASDDNKESLDVVESTSLKELGQSKSPAKKKKKKRKRSQQRRDENQEEDQVSMWAELSRV